MKWLREISDRLRLALDALRGKGNNRGLDRAIVQEVLVGRRPPGFPCPRCGERVIVQISSLLSRSGVACGNCQLDFQISWDEDERCRTALEGVERIGAEIEAAKAFRR